MVTRVVPLFEPAPPATRRRWGWAALVLLLIGCALSWWGFTAYRRALAQVPAAERTQLFRATLTSTRALCRAGPSLQDACVREARLLLAYPECDGDCRAFATRQLPQATR